MTWGYQLLWGLIRAVSSALTSICCIPPVEREEEMLEGVEDSRAWAWEDCFPHCALFTDLSLSNSPLLLSSVTISDHHQRKVPCQLGIKTSRDQNELPTNQLSSAQMVATSCLFLFSQWRVELMAVNMSHLLAALRTATFSQGKGTLNYQLEVGEGLSCRSGPSLPPPRQSWHFHFTYRKPSTAHDKLQTSSLWPRPWLHLFSL